jgi:hypothetical protein
MSQVTPLTEPTDVEGVVPAAPRRTSPFIRAAGLQLCLTVLTLLVLDGGDLANVFVRASMAYWAGVLLIIARRRNSLTRTDLMYLKYGLLVALAISLPIAQYLVELVGLGGWMF